MTSNARSEGSDNPFSEWAPIVARTPLRWPGGASVAVCVILSVEHLEWSPRENAAIPPSAVEYGPYPRAFQLSRVSRAEYGSRVGVFRLLLALDEHGIRPTAAVDAELVVGRKRLVEELMARDAEFVGHGVALSRMITEQMPEADERADIQMSLDAIEQATGRRPDGWLGAEYAESTRTVGLLSEFGLRFVCDWPNDEQPYMLRSDAGELVALPVTVDLDDVMAHKVRRLAPRTWATMVTEAFARLSRDGDTSGRLLVLNLHAHVSGQPFFSRYVGEVLHTIRSADTAWIATAGEIAEYYVQTRGEGTPSSAS